MPLEGAATRASACPDQGQDTHELEGIALAKARGAYTGRKPSLSTGQAEALRARVAAGEPKAALAREFGISRQTLYQYLSLPVPASS